MTPLRVSIAAAIAALILLIIIFELIRSRRLQERYALLWLLTGLVIFVLADLAKPARARPPIWSGSRIRPPRCSCSPRSSSCWCLLHYSTVISKLSEQNTILAQRLAILENRLREGEPGPD